MFQAQRETIKVEDRFPLSDLSAARAAPACRSPGRPDVAPDCAETAYRAEQQPWMGTILTKSKIMFCWAPHHRRAPTVFSSALVEACFRSAGRQLVLC